MKDLKRVLLNSLVTEEYEWHLMQGSYKTVTDESLRSEVRKRMASWSDRKILSLAVEKGHVSHKTLADRKVFSYTDD